MLSKQDALDKLKKYWKIDEFKFLAVLERPKNENGSYKNFGFFKLKQNDRALKYPILDGFRYSPTVNIFIPDARELIDGKTYYIETNLAEDNDRIKFNNPLLLTYKEVFEIEQTTDVLSPKDFIANWFGQKGENPGDAASIAAQLRLNQLELYTQTKRFVFELIQNADDMPVSKKDVEIDIRLLDNYFLFQHTGQYFSRDNVKAICDAAQSTKRNDETKTGYKGIGFKSVFSDSEKVFIFSQDYSFKFDKRATVYLDFKELYKPYWNKLRLEEQRKFFLNFKGQESKYTNIDNVPWQIKPIWVDFSEYPNEILPYVNRNKNVNIALAVGEAKIKEKNYDAMIGSLVEDPRFLLFLRNTKKIRYINPSQREISIEVVKENDETKVYSNDLLQSIYGSFQADIEINNQAFTEAGFDLEHVEVEENKFVFRNREGKILENIPEKLGKLSETVISFAVKKENNDIIPINESESILYNYLPTSDDKYKFPFIVNADFVSKTDREGILAENIWNHYLFFHIGYSLIEWIDNLSGKGLWSSYLKVLPKKLLDEDNQERSTINSAFNRGLLKAIAEVPFIIDATRQRRLAQEVIFDKSGLAKLIGPKTFIDFIGSDKHLANKAIEQTDLMCPYLEIESIGKKRIKDFFVDDDSIEVLNSQITSFKGEKYSEFLKWLDQAELTYEELSQIKFIAFGRDFYSLEEIYEEENKLFLYDDKLERIKDLIKSKGGKIASTDLSAFLNLYQTVTESEKSYYEITEGFYSKIVSFFDDTINEIGISQKNDVLQTLCSLDGINVKTVAKLSWYKNALGELKPLTELYNNDDFVYSSKYDQYFLNKDELKDLAVNFIKETNSIVNLLQNEAFQLSYSSNLNYDASQEDIKLLEILLQEAVKDANVYGYLASKIYWDGNLIDGDLYLDEVSIDFKSSLGEQITQRFKLVSLVSNLTTNNKLLDGLLTGLTGLNPESKEVLRSEVFKLKEFKRTDIISAIQSTKNTISFNMFFYLAIDAWFDKNNVLDLGSSSFAFVDSYFFNLLNFISDNGISNRNLNYKQNGTIYSFLPKGKFVVFDKEFLEDDERVSEVFQNWIKKSDIKKQILIEAGCYDESNCHYKFRRAFGLGAFSECEGLLNDLSKDKLLLFTTAKYVEKFISLHTINTTSEALIVDFYNKISLLNDDKLSSLNYPFLNIIDQTVIFKPLEDLVTCYRYNKEEWRGYNDEIGDYISEIGSSLIFNKLSFPSKYQYKIKNPTILNRVNETMLNEHSELLSESYYEDWEYRARYPIYIYHGQHIPYIYSYDDLVFEENGYEGIFTYKNGNTFYVSKPLENDMPFCIRDMETEAWRSLTEAKYYRKPKEDKPHKPDKSELTDEEVESFKRLFGREYSKADKQAAWLLVAFKALSHYERVGYNISGFEHTLNKKYFEFSKGSKKLTVYPRSAKGDLLYITIQAWENLDNEDVELFVLKKGNIERIINSKDDLLVNGDNLLFSLSISNNDLRKLVVDNLFVQNSLNEVKYNIDAETTLIVRMNNTPEFKSLFVGFGNENKDLYSFGNV